MRSINILSIYLITFILLVGLVSATPSFMQESDISKNLQLESGIPSTHKLGEDYYLHAHVYNATNGLLLTSGLNCYYHFYNHQINGGEHIQTGTMSQYGAGYNATINGSLINQSGEYSALMWCNSTDEGGFLEYRFKVTPSGEELLTPQSISYFSFLLFLFVLMGGFYVIHTSINFEKWNNKIISRYENKNYVKLVFSSIGYNLMKNAFVIYYLIGLVVLVIITDFVYMANIVSIVQFMPSVLVIYSVGIIIVGIYFFGYVQEWLMDLLNKIKDMDWGV